MPLIYHAATLELDDVGPPPAMKQPPIERWKDDLPRRKVVRQLKETLVKSTILVGELAVPCFAMSSRCLVRPRSSLGDGAETARSRAS